MPDLRQVGEHSGRGCREKRTLPTVCLGILIPIPEFNSVTDEEFEEFENLDDFEDVEEFESELPPVVCAPSPWKPKHRDEHVSAELPANSPAVGSPLASDKTSYGLGFASLILGIVSFCVFQISAIGLSFGGVGLLLGAAALIIAFTHGKRGMGYSIAGTGMNVLALATGVLWAVFAVGTPDVVDIESKEDKGSVSQVGARSAANNSFALGEQDEKSAAAAANESDLLDRQPHIHWKPAGVPFTRDNIRITVTRVSLGVVPLWRSIVEEATDSKRDLLTVWLKIENVGRNQNLDYTGWMRPFASLRNIDAFAIDSFDTQYPAMNFGATTSVRDATTNGSIKPGEHLNDAIVFEAPAGGIEYLRLELSAKAFAKEGIFRFEVPQSEIILAAEPHLAVNSPKESNDVTAEARSKSKGKAASRRPSADNSKSPAAVPKIADKPNDEPSEESADSKPATIVEKEPAEPVKKKPATSSTLASLERKAKQAATAKESLALYDEFLTRHELSKEILEKFSERRKHWQQLADQNLVRLGHKWVTAKEAEAAIEEARKLVNRAKDLMRAHYFEQVEQLLDRAILLNPNGIRAPLRAAMLNTTLSVRTSRFFDRATKRRKAAHRYSMITLKRAPDNIVALNNLAITEVKLRRYNQAYRHWKRARDLHPKDQGKVAHNVCRFMNEVKRGTLSPPKAVRDRFQALNTNIIDSGYASSWDPNVGWVFMIFDKSRGKQEGRTTEPKSKKTPKPSPAALIAASTGSGFVIHPGYILTNRHVVESKEYGPPDAIRIVDPADPSHQREFDASLVATSKTMDLAILECPDIKSPAVPVVDTLPRRGSEIMILGYPLSSKIGRSLKATKGSISALPGPVA